MGAPKGNKYAVGNNGGRPPVFKTAKRLLQTIDEYFIYILGEFHLENRIVTNIETNKDEFISEKVWDRKPEPTTITGLTLYLGFSSRASLDDYEKKNEEFSYIIKKGRSRVEHEYEKNLHSNNNTGSIFALKNMGWKDKTEVESNITQRTVIIDTTGTSDNQIHPEAGGS
jgi:hypothetical protein